MDKDNEYFLNMVAADVEKFCNISFDAALAAVNNTSLPSQLEEFAEYVGHDPYDQVLQEVLFEITGERIPRNDILKFILDTEYDLSDIL